MTICATCNEETGNPKYCSSSCSIIASNRARKRLNDKYCINCNKKLCHQGRNPLESRCRKCWRKNIRNKSSIECNSTKAVRIYLIRTRGYKCEVCGLSLWQGIKLPLEADHINGVNTDNREGNVRLLCPNCHSITPTWKGRNKKHKGEENG